MKKLLVICLAMTLLICCDKVLGPDEEDIDVRIHVTGFGGSSSGSSWQKGYVKNHSGPKVVRVIVLWSTDMSSGATSTSPNVLSKGGEGTYYFSYTGKNLRTDVSYDKE